MELSLPSLDPAMPRRAVGLTRPRCATDTKAGWVGGRALPLKPTSEQHLAQTHPPSPDLSLPWGL